jgi:GR25 family glycosyltransferase involved in LPS biosynthesis
MSSTNSINVNSLPIWVINLADKRDRWKSILKSISQSGLPLENVFRFDAINSTTISPGELKNILSPSAFNQLFSNLVYRTSHSQLTLGAVGCYLSHIELWKKLLNSDQSHFLIFEDDTKLTSDFLQTANHVLQRIPEDFDFLFLGSIVSPTSEVLSDSNVIKNKFVSLISVYGAHAYIISKKAVEKLLSLSFPIDKQLDSFISDYNTLLKMYTVIPNIAYQSGFTTDIQNSCKNCGPLIQIYEVNGKRIPIRYIDSLLPSKYIIILIVIILFAIFYKKFSTLLIKFFQRK